MRSAAGMHMLSGLYELLIKKKNVQLVTCIWPTTCAIQKQSKGLQSVNAHNCSSISLRTCVCVQQSRACDCKGRLGGIRPPLQCRVVVNWFWLRAKSPHRHLFVFSTRPEKKTAFTQASHNMSNSLSEPVFGLNTGVNLSKHTQTYKHTNVFPTISYNHGIIKKRKQ